MPLDLSQDHYGLSLTPANFQTTIDWYTTRLGFSVERSWEWNGTPFAVIGYRDIRIELLGLAKAPNPDHPSDIAASHTIERAHHICLATGDLDATLAELHQLGVDPINEVMENPNIEQRFTFITDPVGNIIELTEPGASPHSAGS